MSPIRVKNPSNPYVAAARKDTTVDTKTKPEYVSTTLAANAMGTTAENIARACRFGLVRCTRPSEKSAWNVEVASIDKVLASRRLGDWLRAVIDLRDHKVPVFASPPLPQQTVTADAEKVAEIRHALDMLAAKLRELDS
jgi:hypothetical protein